MSARTGKLTAAAPASAPLTIDQPYSQITINKGEALDHAVMRIKQLSALLDAIGGEGPSSLMWLAQQIVDELVVTVDLIDQDARIGDAA